MRIGLLLMALILLVIGGCSDVGAGFWVGQAPLPEGDLFLGCPKQDDAKGLPDVGNGATVEAGASLLFFSVSRVGEANLSVPIAVPPGRAGMEPAFYLNYSSAGEEGYLGFGFSLSGFSSITRCPKNLADDGEIDAVRDDAGDAFGRLAKSTREIDGETFSLGLNYDAYSRVQSIQYPGAFNIQREYDAHGYIQRIKKGAEPLWQRLASDGAGRTIYEQFGANVSTVREYWHDRNRLKHIHSSTATEVFQELEYDYDDRLNLSFRKDLLQGKTEFFFYDQRDRITDACLLPNAWLPCLKVAEYDAQGNILSKLDVGVYKYEQKRPNTLEEAGGQPFVHDAVGNLRDKPGAHLDYTAFDLPKKVSIPNDELTFDYDGHQQRIRKRSLTKETIYFDRLYERVTDSLTGELRHLYYIYNDERLVSVFSESNLTGNDIRYLHTDHLGSTDVITDAQGQIVERQSFSLFGARRNPQWGSGPLQSGPAEVSRGFTGHEGDDELGLIHMRGRLMDPYLGRFITPDPLISNPQLAQGWNPFVYALNSPLTDIDPSGLSVVTAEPETAKLSPGCQCYEVTVRGPPRQGPAQLPKAVIQEQNEMQAQAPTIDLGTGGLPAGQGAPSPTQSEIPEHYIEKDAGHNAKEAVIGTGEGVGQLLWEAAKANLIEGATLGLRKKWTVMLDAAKGLKRAWASGDWAGFFDTAVDIFNQNYNPLYTAGEHGYYAYNSKKAHDWRGTFRHGTIAAILTVLTVVTTAKGVAGAAKKGTRAAGPDAHLFSAPVLEESPATPQESRAAYSPSLKKIAPHPQKRPQSFHQRVQNRQNPAP